MTVVIVTDYPLITVAMQSIVRNEYPDADIYQVNSLAESLKLQFSGNINLLVLDSNVADGKSSVLITEFKNKNGKAPILVYLGNQLDYMYYYMRLGANGLFSIKATAEEIQQGIRTVCSQKIFVSGEIQQLFVSKLLVNKVLRSLDLTKKEMQLADLFASGKSRAEIAAIAGLHAQSVTAYKRKIFQKLNVRNVIELNTKLKILGESN